MGWLGDVVGGLFQPIVSGLGIAADWYQQNRQFKYDQKLQETIFEREDNATQRRAADLQAAGLSKTLAAGNAAGVGQAIRAQVPGAGLGNRGAEAIMLNSALMKQKADIARTEEETLRIKKEAMLAQNQADYYKELKTKTYYDNLPMNILMNDATAGLTKVDPKTGKLMDGTLPGGVTIPGWMAKMAYDQALNNWTISNENVGIAKSNNMLMGENASIAGVKSKMDTWNYDLTKKLGVRSSDQIDAALEIILQQSGIGKEGTPYATAAKQFFLQLVNGLAGIIK